MKKFYKSNWLYCLRTTAFFAVLILSGTALKAQMSGTYTIDAGSATAGTNFASFTEFKDTISTYGVAGSVTVNVVANSGPYSEKFVLPAIANTSSTNTVTINGNGNTITASGWVVEFNGADYVKIENLRIVATGTTNGTGCIWIHNASNFNTVSESELIISAHTGTNTATAYVMFSSAASSYTATGNHGANNVIENNLMWNNGNTGAGPYFGIADYRAAGDANANTTIDGNEIRHVYYAFTYLYYSKFPIVTNNDIHTIRSGVSSIIGISINLGSRVICSGNYIHDLKASTNQSMIINQSPGNSTLKTLIENNEIYAFTGTSNYGPQVNSSSYVEYNNNSIHDLTSSGYNYYFGGYFSNSHYINVSNNESYNNESTIYNYYAYYMYQCQYSQVVANKVHDNTASQYNYFMFYIYYCDNSLFQENEVYNQQAVYYNYYAFYFAYTNNTILRGNLYYDNTAGYYNIYIFQLQYCQSVTVEDNLIYDNSATYGQQMYFYFYQCPNSVIQRNMANRNSSGQYEYYFMYIYYCDNSSVINNVYADNDATYGFNYILFSGLCNNIVIAHNTVVLDRDIQYTNNYVWYFNYSTTPQNVKFHNNILYINGKIGYGYQYPIYCYYNADQIDFANNVLHIKSAGTNNFYANAAIYTSYALWKEVANDETSVSVDPLFANLAAGDLTPTNPEIANMGTPGLATLDFNKDTRTACGPDPGAFEFFVDHSASNLVFNGTNECGNYMEQVSINFNNGTSVNMNDVEMFYTINGKNKVTEYIDFVGANASKTHTFAKVPTFNTPGNNTLTVGLGCDDDASNNTISHNIFITPSPYGADLSQGSAWNGYWRTGTISDPDITVPGEVIQYTIEHPAKYGNSAYPASWTYTSLIKTEGGTALGPGDGFIINPPSGGSTPGNITIDPVSSLKGKKVYVSIQINDINTGCDSIIGRWLYIPQTPNPDFEVDPVCFGEVSRFNNLSVMPGPDVMAYTWRFGDPNVLDDSAESRIGVYQYTGYGTYTATLEVVNFTYPKFVYTVSKTVTVIPTPEVAFQVVNACEGTAIQFINNSTLPVPGGISYSWNFGDGTASTTIENPTHLYANAKAEGYFVTLIAEASGCESKLTKKAYQFATPVANFSTNGACNLDDVNFINQTALSIGKAGYTWDFGDGGISTAKNPSHVFSTPGTKTVTLKAYSEFGCQNQKTISFSLLPSPEANFEIDQACNLTPVNFTRTGFIPGTPNQNDFQWNFNGQSGSSLENPSFLFSDVGEKEITLTINSLNGCTSTVTKKINVVLQAVADFAVADICEGEPAVFINKSKVSAGDLKYKWFFGDNDSSQHVNPTHAYLTLGNTRVVNVTLRAVVEGGCNAEISRPLTINAAPDASFNLYKEGRHVQVDGPGGMSIYQWSFGDGYSTTTEDASYVYQNVDQGTFTICLNVKNDLCWSVHCETISVNLAKGSVDNLEADLSIEVYPNPNNGIFTVELNDAAKDAEISVIDVLGNSIPLTVVNNLDGTYVVDLSGVAAGVYIVQVKNGTSIATKRITVTR